jgi:hypothetical protein
MISDLVKIASEHGAAAFLVVTICVYHFWWAKEYRKERDSVRGDHKQERAEWRKANKKIQKDTAGVLKDNNQALRDLSAAIRDSNNQKKKRKR